VTTTAGFVDAQCVVPSATTLTVTNNAQTATVVTLTAGTYTMVELCARLQADLNTQAPGSGATRWTVSLSTTTGLVTISISAGTFTIAWTTAALGTMLGHSAITAQTSVTGSTCARGIWIPNRPLNIEDDPRAAPMLSDLRETEGPTGYSLAVVGNVKYGHNALRWAHVPRERYLDTDGGVTPSWERFVKNTQIGQGHSWFTPRSKVKIVDQTGAAVGNLASVTRWWMRGVNRVSAKKMSDAWTGSWLIEIPAIISNEVAAEPSTPVTITTDGPSGYYFPNSLEEWELLEDDEGIPVPNYYFRGQETSGDLTDEVQGATMIDTLTPLYQQTLTDWSMKWLRTNEVATEGFHATAGQLWNTNVQSVVWVFYFRVITMPGGLRVLAMLSGAGAYVSLNGSGIIQLRNSGTTTGTYNYDDGEEHFCAVEYICGAGILGHSGAGTWRLSTDKEQLTGTWEICPDDVKGIGGCGTFTPPEAYYIPGEAWVGTDAEAVSTLGVDTMMEARGWTLAY
jgi:hypothetical protein